MDGDPFEAQGLFGDTSGYYASGGLAGGSSAATPPVPDAVFLLVGLVGMSRAIGVSEPFVVLRPGISVANKESNGCAYRFL